MEVNIVLQGRRTETRWRWVTWLCEAAIFIPPCGTRQIVPIKYFAINRTLFHQLIPSSHASKLAMQVVAISHGYCPRIPISHAQEPVPIFPYPITICDNILRHSDSYLLIRIILSLSSPPRSYYLKIAFPRGKHDDGPRKPIFLRFPREKKREARKMQKP